MVVAVGVSPAETKLYYLNTRYYDPVTSRYLNADDTDVLGVEQGSLIQDNLFAYCLNNPVNMFDPDGEFAMALAGGGYLAGSWALGGANFWNPFGWVVLGIAAVGTVSYVGYKIYQSSKSKKLAKKKTAKKNGKEKASDAPDWAKRQKYDPKKSADDNVRRVLDDKYGKGKWKKGAGDEYSQIKKWLQRSKGYK